MKTQKHEQKRFKPKYHVRKNDVVIVVSGDDKGKEGRILDIEYGKNRAWVDGINMISKHSKPTAEYPNGGIIKKEAPIHLSKLMIKDPKTGKPTRIGRQLKEGKLVRYAKKSGEIID